MVFQTLGTAAVPKSVLGLSFEFWFVGDHVLGAGVGVVMRADHAGLCADLGRADSGSSVVVGCGGVVEEERVLVEIVLRPLYFHARAGSHAVARTLTPKFEFSNSTVTYLFVLDVVLVLVARRGCILSHVFDLSKFAHIGFARIFALGLAEGEVGC